MAAILASLWRTVTAGVVLAVIFFLVYLWISGWDGGEFWSFLFRWLHVLSGVMWIGLLWYFNFVQIPNMGKIPDDQQGDRAGGPVLVPLGSDGHDRHRLDPRGACL